MDFTMTNYNFWSLSTDTNGEYTFKMAIYKTSVNIKVGNKDMDSMPVDMLFSFTASNSIGTATAMFLRIVSWKL